VKPEVLSYTGLLFYFIGYCFVRVDTCDGKNIRDFYRVVLPGCQFEFWPKHFRVCRLWAGLRAYNFAVHQEVLISTFVAEFIDNFNFHQMAQVLVWFRCTSARTMERA